MGEVLAAGVAAFVVVLILTRWVILIGSRGQWWEPLSPRGSHTVPTLGRGGIGFVIFLSLSLPFYALAWLGGRVAATFTLAGLAIAFIGLLDDARPLPVLPRILVHILAVTVAGLVIGTQVADAGASWFLAGASAVILASGLGVAWVWFINLFNFMDGIDGIAAAEVVFVATAASVLSVETGHPELASAWAVVAGACLGFLFWNAPPAKIFMGNVGSGFLGFIVGGLLLLSVDAGAFPPWVAPTLVATFLGDATVTLLRRMLRGEPWYEGHRQHAYQHLATRWKSHGRVTGAYSLFNVFVIAPAAWYATQYPTVALPILVVIAIVVFALALWAGAGAPATSTEEGPRSV
jgi:Fuc2NAc and GlcNAc transferase